MSALWHTREVTEVIWSQATLNVPTFARKKKPLRGRRGQGIRYEVRAQRYLQELYGLSYYASPWFKYREHETEMLRWCQPDGLLIDVEKGILWIVEIKYQHTYEAYRQLIKCYLQVIEKSFPPELWEFRFVEVVKWYDPQVKLPVEVKLCKLPHYAAEGDFGVHIWRP